MIPIMMIMITIATGTIHIYIDSSHVYYFLLSEPSCIISFLLYKDSQM